jgi:hypothetical protein
VVSFCAISHPSFCSSFIVRLCFHVLHFVMIIDCSELDESSTIYRASYESCGW